MGVTSTSTMPLSQYLSGPPLYILSLAVALEILFWVFDIQVQFVEVWIVALVVPLALSLAKPAEDKSSKRPAKKVFDEASRAQDPRKKAPQAAPGRKPATERPPASLSAVEQERNAQ